MLNQNWRKNLLHHGILIKMVVRSVAMLALTLLGVEYLSYHLSSDQIVKMTEEQQTAITHVYAERIQKKLETVEDDLKNLAEAPSLRDYHRNRIYDLTQEADQSLATSTALFRRLAERVPDYLFLTFDYSNGEELIHVGSDGNRNSSKARQPLRREKLPRPSSGIVFEGVPDADRAEDQVVVFSIGVFDTDHKAIGTVKSGYRLGSLLAQLKNEKLFETGHLAVFESDGKIIYFPGKKVHDPIQAIHPELGQLVRYFKEGASSGNIRIKLDVPSIVGFTPVPGRNWVVSAFVTEEQMFSVLNTIKKIVLLVVGLNILVELFFIALFVRMVILKPINEMLEVTRKIKAGDLSARVKVKTRDELAELAQSVNEMTLSLEGHFRQVQEFNTTLERKVEARTAELKEAQGALLNSGKLMALGEMAGGIAHEINNPLAIIKTRSEQLREIVDDVPLDVTLIKAITSDVEKTTDRIARIVQGLRTFSRDGSSDPFQAVNLRELVSDTISFCHERFRSCGIELRVEPIDESLQFEGRATQISQVLLNLLNNAHDAIFNSQEKWVKVSALRAGENIEIRVVDSGAGIPVEIQKKIFQPFFTTKEIGKGTGIGLSISFGIVRAHHGEIRIDDKCANTCFIVRLPLQQNTSSQVA